MEWAIFLKWPTMEGISVFSLVAGRPVTKSRETWRMDVGEMAEMEGVPLWLDKLVLTAELTGFDKVQVIILQSNWFQHTCHTNIIQGLVTTSNSHQT